MWTRRDGGRTEAEGASSIPDPDVLSRRTEEAKERWEREVMGGLSHAQELTGIASTLTRGNTYRVVLSRPVQGALNARADGMLDAFVKGRDGKIVAVARLQQAGSALLASVSSLSGYVMLVQISGQLRDVQASVEQILVKMDAAKQGKVDSAFKLLEHIQDYKPENQRPMLHMAANTLSEELGGFAEGAKEHR